ncbi:uncharacterized protein Z520_09827 [Fonsecaea multimorphosa CBS 102226]|uniref:Kri1-like C-terminal domain-containing protein n=1 Tax=Fonsecaea multimorphosa CBS 102226 TaxID=1442371 RepID=A0A0D2IBC7_9EURO|nr:uncharacterized protein Z520_09827 [Fonsecaea multimorphosa CBS 102226]KIX94441.1 hypothetical protein Z520_09827 [Fonsecaea multimorphosa CBS 102226]OAL20022.1 hypothetical protein AYO22_09172 [Fonsecaea multimorphosa]
MARELLSSDSSDSEDGGADVPPSDELKVNEAYARRFEHNKKREELQRLEEKLGKSSTSRKRKRGDNESLDGDDKGTDSDDDSTSESEDEGELVTEALDSEIMATLNAIRSKDPRVYDQSVTFYTNDDDEEEAIAKARKEKPMHLQDYHRQNLLKGDAGVEEEDTVPLTYNQEQEQLKKSIIGEINAAAEEDDDEEEDEGEDKFLIAKRKEKSAKADVVLDVDNADKDPETFLSNFMASRAWAAPDPSNLHPFESDDDEEDKRADEFEEAYNLRFEDPEKSNETLRSHARDLAAKYSVRRQEANPRQKKREAEKAKREAEKQLRKEEKARLRKLKIEELEEKVRRIKRAAGIKTQDIRPEDWSHLVDDDWDDAKWEEEMRKRFGDEYYAEEDLASEDETHGRKRKPRKPKFDDDLDIKDIVPDFDGGDKADFSLTDEDAPPKKAKKGKKSVQEDKRDTKKERRIIEQLVTDQLQLELDASLPNKKTGGFTYRETSPKSFGLTARDILLADDKQLNEFVGLKKLASFRDPEKKRKDTKNLGKKARLRKWRLETFGNEEGLQASNLIPARPEVREDRAEEDEAGVDIRTEGTKKKKRRRNKKSKTEVDTVV